MTPSGRDPLPGVRRADVLYAFRVASFTAQALMWGVLGLVFGGLVERRIAKTRARSGRPGRVTSGLVQVLARALARTSTHTPWAGVMRVVSAASSSNDETWSSASA